MPWKKIVLDRQDIRGGTDDRIKEAFVECIAEAGWPEDAVMYGDEDSAENGYCYFFPPAAVKAAEQFLKAYEATDCLAPDTAQLTVLVKRTSGGRRDL
jgi:hypothetical protein